MYNVQKLWEELAVLIINRGNIFTGAVDTVLI